MLKGISPLVATVLLIAITMTLAGIVAFWGSTFVRGGLPTENQTQQIQTCAGGSIKLFRDNFSSNVLTLNIYNDGSQKLSLTNITIVYSDRTDVRPIGQDISPGELKVLSFDNVTANFTEYLLTTNCANIYIRITR